VSASTNTPKSVIFIISGKPNLTPKYCQSLKNYEESHYLANSTSKQSIITSTNWQRTRRVSWLTIWSLVCSIRLSARSVLFCLPGQEDGCASRGNSGTRVDRSGLRFAPRSLRELIVLMMFRYMRYWWSRAENGHSREPRLVGFNTGPGPGPGIRSVRRCRCYSTWTLTHKSTSHCHSTLRQHG